MELRLLSLVRVGCATALAVACSSTVRQSPAENPANSVARSDVAEPARPSAREAPETAHDTPQAPVSPISDMPEASPSPARAPVSSPTERAADDPPPSAAVGATDASLSTADVDEPPIDLPRGTTVLHIGDSFAGALGIELNREFKAAGVRGILKYETATYIPTWAWGKDLAKYLDKYHPDLVLITLGANELEIPDPEARAPTIRHLVERLAGRPCVWVAPPLWHGARPALLDVIRSSCAPCAYLDSSVLVPELPRARDGIHPAMAARRAWARAVVEWLGQHRRSNEGEPWHLMPE